MKKVVSEGNTSRITRTTCLSQRSRIGPKNLSQNQDPGPTKESSFPHRTVSSLRIYHESPPLEGFRAARTAIRTKLSRIARDQHRRESRLQERLGFFPYAGRNWLFEPDSLRWPYGKNALDVALLCGLLGSRRDVADRLDQRFPGRSGQRRTIVGCGEKTGKGQWV